MPITSFYWLFFFFFLNSDTYSTIRYWPTFKTMTMYQGFKTWSSRLGPHFCQLSVVIPILKVNRWVPLDLTELESSWPSQLSSIIKGLLRNVTRPEGDASKFLNIAVDHLWESYGCCRFFYCTITCIIEQKCDSQTPVLWIPVPMKIQGKVTPWRGGKETTVRSRHNQTHLKVTEIL